MIRKTIGLLVVLLLLAPQSSDSLTSGWLAQEKEFQSAIQIWTVEKNKPKFLCSGVVVAPDTVLTAKSCIYGPDKIQKETTLFISTAPVIDYKMSLKQALQSIASVAKQGIPHPDADLMIIFLNTWLNVEPALLLTPSEAFQIRLLPHVFLVGFGQNGEQTENPHNDSWWRSFWSGKKPSGPGQKFTAKSQIVQVEARELQLGSAKDDGAACLGDEGGPIFAHIESPFANSQRVLGFFTNSQNQKNCLKPSPAIRLDAFRDFINDTMVQECRKKERIWCQVEGLLNPGYNDEPQVDPKSDKKPEPIPPDQAAASEPTQTPATQAPANEPKPGVDATPRPAPAPETVQPAPAPQKPIKRRLKVSAEGAGCSCSQVFTKLPQ